ncbi:AraC family transcriptional regulator [Paenibacillus sp. JJ-223]|uniref:AraC family transcriptional regulator n=1 Tax=Paenibacillus sp. JJ-223 TaxID=2905647 RepID=UPI001F27B25F|nr:AraC family transcriptional regulator [Paenibacillus sp. JJ-223]CAH1221777.1 HTH-type transcriptional activator RhaS [Paenibacillus sp. JJ-223]
MLAFRLTRLPDARLPLYLYCVGTHEERALIRADGFPVYQLFLSRSGEGQLNVSGEGTWKVTAGQLFVLAPDKGYEYCPRFKTDWELGYIGIGGDAAASILRAAGLLQSGPRTLHDFEQFWSRMTALWHSLNQGLGPDACWEVSAMLYQLILDLSRWIDGEPENAAKRTGRIAKPAIQAGLQHLGQSDPRQDAFDRAVDLMHMHYRDDLLLKHVAEAVGYSVQHLNRIFHQKHGITGHQYMQRLRLRKAADWLNEHPHASVKQAAETIGMEVNYFIRMFKREFGETPGRSHSHARE